MWARRLQALASGAAAILAETGVLCGDCSVHVHAWQVVRDAAAQGASRAGGSDDDSEDDAEAIRRANAAAISQRQHQQRVSSEQKAKAAEQKQKQVAKAGNKEAVAKDAVKPADKAVRKAADPAASKAFAGAPAPELALVETGKGKAAGKGNGKAAMKGAAPTKKGRAAEQDNDSESDSESDSGEDRMDWTRKAGPEDDDFSSDSGSDADEINVTFDCFNPVEEDFHGIKLFLAGLLDEQNFDSSGLVDLVLGQSGEVGSVVKIMDEEEVYGVLSVVDVATASSVSPCLKQISDFILKKCPKSKHVTFAEALRRKTGLIISERMINMPPEMAVPLLDGLCNELKDANTDKVSPPSPPRP